MSDKPFLLLSDDADSFASMLSVGSFVVCTTVAEAMDAYDGQEILFGQPDLVAAVLPAMPEVRWVQSTWAGVKPLIDLPLRHYQLTGVKGVFGPQMAEYVIGYLLAHELKILARNRRQQDRTWFDEDSGTLRGKRMGIMGAGSIGSDIAAMAVGFGMSVTGLNRSGRSAPCFESVCSLNALPEFLSNLDYLVSVLPNTPATDRLLNADTLAYLPRGTVFINVGRGNVIDEAALIEALDSSRLAAAVLDVFQEEPLPPDSPLWAAKNLHITAHVAALSHAELIVPLFEDNYRRYATGRPLRHLVDFEAGY